MAIIRYFKKIQLLDSLIRRKATGNQHEFAKKAGMSRGLLNMYLNEMKELGFPISYNRARCTYYYEEKGKIVSSLFEREIEDDDLRKIQGGILYGTMAAYEGGLSNDVWISESAVNFL